MTVFEGVIPPIITPYDKTGAIDEAALGRLVTWYADEGCHGLWFCGGTGEGVMLTADERLQMVELASETVAGRMKIIFHVGAVRTADAVCAARRAEEVGIDAVCSVPPFFFGKSDDETVLYYRRIAEATSLPLFLYNLPDAAGRKLTVPLIERLLHEVPSIVGMKHSAGVVDTVGELLHLKDDLQILIGRGETTLAALTLGARGVVCTSLCLAPERFIEVWRAFQSRDLAGAMAAQQRATEVKEIFRRFPPIAAAKRINSEQIGIDCGPPREPLAGLTAEEENSLLNMAHEIGLLTRQTEAASVLDSV